MTRILDMLPSWAYASIVAVLTALLVASQFAVATAEVDVAKAQRLAAAAGADLANVRAAAAGEAASAVQAARASDQKIFDKQAKDVDEHRATAQANADRAADMERRWLRERTRAAANTSAGGERLPEGSRAAGAGDEGRAAGLPGVDGPAFIRYAKSAKDTADTLILCRARLHDAWRTTN